jgi:hypothetical protein
MACKMDGEPVFLSLSQLLRPEVHPVLSSSPKPPNVSFRRLLSGPKKILKILIYRSTVYVLIIKK